MPRVTPPTPQPPRTDDIEPIGESEPDSPFSEAAAQMSFPFSTSVPPRSECWVSGTPAVAQIPPHIANRPLPKSDQETQDLTGVVIWPHQLQCPQAEIRRNQGRYGRHLHQGIQLAANALRQGLLPGLLDLWKLARDIRTTAPGPINRAFNESRHPSLCGDLYYPCFTPLCDKYDYLIKRLREHPQFDDKNAWLQSRIGTLVDAEGRARDVPLTGFSLQPEIDSPVLVAQGVPQAFARICHTDAGHLTDVLHHADDLYRQALREEDDARFRQIAARLYWWLAHAMPDERGSAAKTEICYRALHASHGLACPLWRPGVSADIEAMLRTEEAWLEDYRSLTREPPVKAPLPHSWLRFWATTRR